MAEIKEQHPTWFKMKIERRELIRQLSPGTAVKVLLACWDYLETGESPPAGELSPIESVAFAAFIPDMEEAWGKYQQRITAKKGKRKNRTISNDIVRHRPTSYEGEEEEETETETETETEEEEEKDLPGKISLSLPVSEVGRDFVIYRKEVESLSRKYPALDVEEALRKLKDWLSRHPERQRPRSGTHEIMDRWLGACNTKAKKESRHSVYEELDNAELWLPDLL